MRLLLVSGVLVTPDRRGADTPPDYWEPQDLTFHTHSRFGRKRPQPLSASAGRPELERRGRGERIRLPEPRNVPQASLWTALSTRKSTRSFSRRSLTLGELSSLLHFAARATGPRRHRAYPSGGGLYPLEVYLLWPPRTLPQLEAGLYRYEPVGHALQRCARWDERGGELLRRARGATGGTLSGKWVLVGITARLERVANRYERLAYSLVSKEVGCVLEAFYLVAAGLNLGVCALGVGSLDGLPKLAGTSVWAEPQVGELVIGALPSERSV